MTKRKNLLFGICFPPAQGWEFGVNFLEFGVKFLELFLTPVTLKLVENLRAYSKYFQLAPRSTKLFAHLNWKCGTCTKNLQLKTSSLSSSLQCCSAGCHPSEPRHNRRTIFFGIKSACLDERWGESRNNVSSILAIRLMSSPSR